MEMTTTLLAAGLLLTLLVAGVLCWWLAHHQRRQELLQMQAGRLLRALQRYSDWVRAQRLAAVFQGEGQEAAAALDAACTIRLTWFPDLAGDMAEVLAVHNRLVSFLSHQQALWLRDPEHWMESEHDKRFMALWRQHCFAVQALQAKLERIASFRTAPPGRDTTYA